MPYKVEVIADSSGEWCGNRLLFSTVEEAEEYAKDLHSRWTLVREWRVMWTAEDNPHYLFRDLTLEEVEKFRQHARDNDPPNVSNWDIYHPICREVWQSRGIHPQEASNAD